jgi:hypothetical protein
VPGPSLSVRLPTLTVVGPVWLSHGMRGPGIAESEEAQEGSAQLEVALPSRLDDQRDRAAGGCVQEQAERVVIGTDPHKRSATIEVMTAEETVIGGGRSAPMSPGSPR